VQSFTPSARTYRTYALGLVPVTLLLLGIFTFEYGLDSIFFGALGAGAVVTALIVWLYLHNEKVEADRDTLVIHGMFGRVRTFGADGLHRCVLALRYQQPAGYYSVDVASLWVLDATGRPVLQWVSSVWPLEQMRALVAQLGLPHDEIDTVVNGRQLRERYPYIMRFWQARPRLVGLIIGLGIVIGFFVAVAIIVSFQ
jgi:hypothetical protein